MDKPRIYFIALISLIVLLLLAWLFYRPIKKLVFKRKYKKIYYRKVYKVALYEDFYLINNFGIKADKDKVTTIDHLLFGNKWIYVIQDYYYSGEISGKIEDDSWIYNNGKHKVYIQNLLKGNAALIRYLTTITQIKESMFISIVLVNDDLNFKIEGVNNLNDAYLTHRKDLPKIVKALEKRNVETFNEEELSQAVLDISRLNLNKKNEQHQRRSKKKIS